MNLTNFLVHLRFKRYFPTKISKNIYLTNRMQRVHFIAIGGEAIQNLAIALSKKNSFLVTGSDSEISESGRIRLKECRVLPDELGWFPDKIYKGLQAVVLGESVMPDNPELMRAKELGLKIHSMPEFIFQQTRSKTRIVVAGSHGKRITTAMILYVLKQLKMDADYVVSAPIDGSSNRVKLSYESRIAVFEGEESQTSAIDTRPKFHLYKPHIAVITGIAKECGTIFGGFENYVQQFRKFADLMEVQGRLIYYAGDERLNEIAESLRRDIVPFPYSTPDHEAKDGRTYLKTKYGEIPLMFTGEYNLQNMDAARLACRQIGVSDEQFYSVISGFSDESGLK
ncbi:MAG: Mur ligase family protein [Paludibacter sp.]|nr:Mur ligase family protein [Paludibacter sp.]